MSACDEENYENDLIGLKKKDKWVALYNLVYLGNNKYRSQPYMYYWRVPMSACDDENYENDLIRLGKKKTMMDEALYNIV